MASPFPEVTHIPLEERECGPVVEVSPNVTVRGICLQAEGASCDCFVEQRCPAAVHECYEEIITNYCCCYRIINPPLECFDVQEERFTGEN